MTKLIDNPTVITTAGLVALNQHSHHLLIKPSKKTDGRAGQYQSMFKGRGMAYSESRHYQAGDDIRHIDWRVTARTGKAHTKLFYAERERQVYVVVDFRAAMFFATKGKYKSVIAAELASLFAWATYHQRDCIGGIILSESGLNILKPKPGKAAVLHLIKAMVAHPSWQAPRHDNAVTLLPALVQLRSLVKSGSLILLFSDFHGFDDEASTYLLQLQQHNQLILYHIYDGLDACLPPAGLYNITNGNTLLTLDTYNKKFVANYEQRFRKHQHTLQALAYFKSIHYLSYLTHERLAEKFKRGFNLAVN